VRLLLANLIHRFREWRERRRLIRDGRIIDLTKYPFSDRRRW